MSVSRTLLLLCLASLAPCLPVTAAEGEHMETPQQGKPEKRHYQASRLQGSAPTVDGRLQDACWNQGTWAADYHQREPNEGAPASHPTELKVLYDNRYLYVAMRAHQPGVGKAGATMGARDEFTGDMAGIAFDSYHNLRSAFEFDVTSGGSKIDLILKNDGSVDTSWNAVWEVKTHVEADVWTAEYRIPLSQLRYPSGKDQVWGLHAWRWLQDKQEESNWSLIPMDHQGMVYSFGELHGINDLPPSRRLELLPHVIGKLATSKEEPGNPFSNGKKTATDYGLDLKYGISSDFTFDLTVNPDFAQVDADPSEINLSTVETFLRERRPYFLEGKDIFDLKFGDDTPFYSRRIGDAPALTPRTDGYSDRPETTRILFSAKLTGRTASGLSLGLLHATTDRMETRVLTPDGVHDELAEPLANADIVRIQQDLNGGNTSIGALFTSNLRTGGDYELRQLTQKAFTAGIDGFQYWGDRAYLFEARILASQVQGSTEAITGLMTSPVHNFQRPDADHLELDPEATTLNGDAGFLKLGRVNNGVWRYNAYGSWRSPGLDFNDLGYLQAADKIMGGGTLQYYNTDNGALLRRRDIRLVPYQTWDYSGELVERGLYLQSEFATLSGAYLWSRIGGETSRLDTRVLRGGPALKDPDLFYANLYSEGPGSMKLQPKIDAGYTRTTDDNSDYYRIGPGLVARLSGRFKAELSFKYEDYNNPAQFVAISPVNGADAYIMGSISQQTLASELRLDMNFTPLMSLSYFGGPFASSGRYTDFKRVTAPRAELDARFTTVSVSQQGSSYLGTGADEGLRFQNPDFDWRELKSNLVFRWEYRAGSTLYCVWSQYRSDWENIGGFSPSSQYRRLFEAHPDNSFLVKLSYWFSI